jgi:glycine/D-amino acid oxidase-like deaminating enzyme
VTVLEAREICSGATGRNGGRINCTAVQDFDKYRKIFGLQSAIRIVRFELAHLEAIKTLVTSLGPQALRASEVREVDAIAVVFKLEAVEELKVLLKNFEDHFPDLKGRWTVVGQEELGAVRDTI